MCAAACTSEPAWLPSSEVDFSLFSWLGDAAKRAGDQFAEMGDAAKRAGGQFAEAASVAAAMISRADDDPAEDPKSATPAHHHHHYHRLPTLLVSRSSSPVKVHQQDKHPNFLSKPSVNSAIRGGRAAVLPDSIRVNGSSSGTDTTFVPFSDSSSDDVTPTFGRGDQACALPLRPAWSEGLDAAEFCSLPCEARSPRLTKVKSNRVVSSSRVTTAAWDPQATKVHSDKPGGAVSGGVLTLQKHPPSGDLMSSPP